MENNENSKTKVASSFFWVLVERFGYSGINLLSMVILARLLTSYEFGLIGTITIITSISNMIIESGLGASLVNKKNINQKDYNTVFTFNLLMSFLLYILIFTFAPSIASYFGEIILADIIRVLSLTLIFNAFSVIQRVILIKNLLFKKQSFISILSLLISVSISIFAATKGWGTWAIVLQLVLYSGIYSVFVFFTIKYIPRIQFSLKSFKELFGFGGRVMISGVIQVSYSDIISSVISKVYAIQTTGLYTQSQKLIGFPVYFFRSLFDGAAFPILSKINDKNDFKRMVSQINRGIYLLAFPLLIAIPFNSKEIIKIVLGEHWIEANKIFTILSMGVIVSLVDVATFSTLKSAGESKSFLSLGTAKAIIGVSLLSVTFLFDIEVLLYGIIFTNIMTMIMAIHYVGILTLYKVKEQLKDIFIPFIIAMVANIIAFYTVKNLNLNKEIISLIMYIVITFLIFIFQCFLFNIQEFKLIINKIGLKI
ncbi:lipopolysaccharide biosynthesis protein [Capnocytophaga cynodegmi]|uniref:lipopolysaccharide biosynthesis protein n=1 Tax=Capnocytophaga cynodegmi TaxID=28189 RepID=UPI001AD4D190|nr:lipopolysaccharide biosynthesis protein [Capnocytophaga cynodegmi]GIM54974.1 lipopolysaccharide biosynthesis protein [Capnocytophaga cynodegmi]